MHLCISCACHAADLPLHFSIECALLLLIILVLFFTLSTCHRFTARGWASYTSIRTRAHIYYAISRHGGTERLPCIRYAVCGPPWILKLPLPLPGPDARRPCLNHRRRTAAMQRHHLPSKSENHHVTQRITLKRPAGCPAAATESDATTPRSSALGACSSGPTLEYNVISILFQSYCMRFALEMLTCTGMYFLYLFLRSTSCHYSYICIFIFLSTFTSVGYNTYTIFFLLLLVALVCISHVLPVTASKAIACALLLSVFTCFLYPFSVSLLLNTISVSPPFLKYRANILFFIGIFVYLKFLN